MARTLAEMSKQANELLADYTLRLRSNKNAAIKAHNALQRLTPEQVEILSGICPDLREVVKFSVEDLAENRNSAVARLHQAENALREFAEQRLQYFEEQL